MAEKRKRQSRSPGSSRWSNGGSPRRPLGIEPLEGARLLSVSTLDGNVDTTGDLRALASMGSGHISPDLLSLVPGGSPSSQFIYDAAGDIGVHITADDVNQLAAPLAAWGSKRRRPTDLHFLEGFVPITAIPQLNGLVSDGLLGVLPSYPPITHAGTVNSQTDIEMEAARVRWALPRSYDGTGVTVGVLSDSYNSLGTAAQDVVTGDLPSNVHVLSDLPTGKGTDEGRAMLQLVHNVAPRRLAGIFHRVLF